MKGLLKFILPHGVVDLARNGERCAISAGQNPQAFMDGAADKVAEEAAKLAK